MKIAYLGPEGSYSHLAAKAFLKTEEGGQGWNECMPFRNFAEVLNALEKGRVDGAAIPIENSLQGGVSQNLDLLQEYADLYAVKEYVLRIDHRLVYKEGVSLSDIGRVYSHRQALDQCTEFLSKQMPFASLRETESTAFGLTKATEDDSGKSAAIAGAHTENIRKGFVLSEECISDEKNNFTHFLLVKKGKEKLPKTSERIFFSVVGPHRPGGLLEILAVIYEHGVNMTKIESRPVKDTPGDYRFFIEADCDVGSQKAEALINGIKEKSLDLKLLGAY